MSDNENYDEDSETQDSDNSPSSQPFSDNTTQGEDSPALFNLFESWSALSLNERRSRFSDLPRTEAEELFLSINTHDQAELISEASALEKRSWVRMLAPDDVADLIQELGVDDHRDEILHLLDHQTRREVTALLAYAEDNAGGLMNSRFVRLRPDMSVDEAISYLRIQAKTQVETIYYAYVIDADQTLMGVTSFRELFSAAPHKKIREIMKTDLIRVPVNMEQEEIAKVFSRQELTAIPVVDEWGHMKGIVTFDDIASVIQEEATEDIQKLGAVEALDAPYMKISFVELVKKRAGWLLILFVSEMFTATAMGHYQHEIEKAVVLALFIPLIISSGGNSGSQASTLIIRAMALGEIRLRDWWRVFLRELGAGLSLGIILGLVGFCRIMIWPGRETLYGPHFALIAYSVAGSILGVVMWGSLSGSMLPFLLRLLRFDPASASAPFVATLCDVTGLVIYFSVASLFLSGTIL
jgi:magnesium transporter